jgi:hypothetical protein
MPVLGDVCFSRPSTIDDASHEVLDQRNYLIEVGFQ